MNLQFQRTVAFLFHNLFPTQRIRQAWSVSSMSQAVLGKRLADGAGVLPVCAVKCNTRIIRQRKAA